MYGIWNSMRKEFQFGICETTKAKAHRALFRKIGHNSLKWRFEPRYISGSPSHDPDFICTRETKTRCMTCVKAKREVKTDEA